MAEFTTGAANVNISAFKQRLSGGGARPNLFEVVLSLPDGLTFSDASGVQGDARFLCKAAALPASNLGVVEVPFRGRQLKVAGDRTFDTWTVTIVNDTDFKIRSAMEAWTNQINNNYTNIGVQDPTTYQVDAFVGQLDRAEKLLRTYKFFGIFPTNVSQIDLAFDNNDTVEEFTVEFQVQWWQAQAGAEGGETIGGANF